METWRRTFGKCMSPFPEPPREPEGTRIFPRDTNSVTPRGGQRRSQGK